MDFLIKLKLEVPLKAVKNNNKDTFGVFGGMSQTSPYMALQ